jgi:hypothetical protein
VRGRAATAFIVVMVLLSGCTGATSTPVRPAVASQASTPSCPTLSGQDCRGRLARGTYTSRAFTPTLTYTVPDGWSNRQDRPGNFVLLPPGQAPGGLNTSKSDFISVFSNVLLNDTCRETHPRGIVTPTAMTHWLAHRPAVLLTHARAVTLGGLSGTVQDIRMAPGWRRSCFDWDHPAIALYSGEPPSIVSHALDKRQLIRLYLLSSTYFGDPVVLAVEVTDVDPHGGLASYDAVARTFRFGRPL